VFDGQRLGRILAGPGVFADDTHVAFAMLDRSSHRSVVFDIDGDSYRMRVPTDPRAERLSRLPGTSRGQEGAR